MLGSHSHLSGAARVEGPALNPSLKSTEYVKVGQSSHLSTARQKPWFSDCFLFPTKTRMKLTVWDPSEQSMWRFWGSSLPPSIGRETVLWVMPTQSNNINFAIDLGAPCAVVTTVI